MKIKGKQQTLTNKGEIKSVFRCDMTCLETRILFPVEMCLFIVCSGVKEKLK